jgi:hypothetical protein
MEVMFLFSDLINIEANQSMELTMRRILRPALSSSQVVIPVATTYNSTGFYRKIEVELITLKCQVYNKPCICPSFLTINHS